MATIEQRQLVKANIAEIGENINEVSRLFFRELFRLDLSLKHVFSGDVIFLNRKFANMLVTFKNTTYLERISASVEKMGERHGLHYGARIEHLPLVREALLKALADYFGEHLSRESERAWQAVFDEVSAIMAAAMHNTERQNRPSDIPVKTPHDIDLLDEIGGEEVILKVHQRFYDNMFDEPWLGQFFYGKSKPTLILKQTRFMLAAFGGANNYTGDTPAFVHMHMFITDEMADLRQRILRQAILAEGLSPETADRWLAIDNLFRRGIVKQSIEECIVKCRGQIPVTVKKPLHYAG